MTKKDVIKFIYQTHPDISQKDIQKVLQSFFDTVKNNLAKGQRINFRGFGSFAIRKRRSHHTQNPRTGERLYVEEKTLPFFRAGQTLKTVVSQHTSCRPLKAVKKTNFFSSLYQHYFKERS